MEKKGVEQKKIKKVKKNQKARNQLKKELVRSELGLPICGDTAYM